MLYVEVGFPTTKDVTPNEWYNEQYLSIISGCYNEQRYYNESGRMLSADVALAYT
jgi:hypothetical protein